MRWTRQLRLRLRSLLRRSRVDQELDEEFRHHLDHLVDDYTASGMHPEDARDAALRDMGGLDQRKEECRDARRVALVEHFVRDVRLAIRGIIKNPGFTAAVALSLALGIGANTAIFTLMDAVLWRLLPVDDPEGLLAVGWPGLLFGLEATDPATIAAAGCILAAVAMLAAYLPAHRAARVNPMVVLRAE